MDFIFDKLISNLYRPGLISFGLNNTLGKARELMAFFSLSQEDLDTAGIILDDPGRAGKDAFLNYRSDGKQIESTKWL